MKKAFITGISGQDGRCLSQHLLSLGYEVWGMVRRSSDTSSIETIKKICSKIAPEDRLKLRYGDMTDSASIHKILRECKPDKIFNLAAQSHVRISFDIPEYTNLVNGSGVVYLLDAMKEICSEAKIYHASTSEIFGSTPPPQNELTVFHPRSPYGVAKLNAYWAIINYRESFQLFAAQGLLFNHESEYRPDNFVTRKITKATAKYYYDNNNILYLGNLDAKRDWGYAFDYVKGMNMILDYKDPEEFVLATGIQHSIRELVNHSFNLINVQLVSNGEFGDKEKLLDSKTNRVIVEIDPRFYRPAEVDSLCGDYSKAKRLLGWEPETTFEQLVEIMLKNDLVILK